MTALLSMWCTMRLEGVEASSITLIATLPAAHALSALHLCHAGMCRHGVNTTVWISGEAQQKMSECSLHPSSVTCRTDISLSSAQTCFTALAWVGSLCQELPKDSAGLEDYCSVSSLDCPEVTPDVCLVRPRGSRAISIG